MTRSKTCGRTTAATAKLRQDAHDARMAVAELQYMARRLALLMSEADRRLRVSAEMMTACGAPEHAGDARELAARIAVSRKEWVDFSDRDLNAAISKLTIPF